MRSFLVICAVCLPVWAALAGDALAESVAEALASAYASNPEINSARAETRAEDENVPIARAGRRPTITGFGALAGARTDMPLAGADRNTLDGTVGVEITQNVFTGFRVKNGIKRAEAGVLSSRETLNNTVQNVLYDAAQAYMDVLRDEALLSIRKRNVIFLLEQVRATSERFDVGENTRTDVSQARARLAESRAGVAVAEANLAISGAVYRQIVGHDPGRLSQSFPYAGLVPSTLGQAYIVGENSHPIVLAAVHAANAQAFAVKEVEGELLPSVSVSASVEHNESFNTSSDPNSVTVAGRISIPFFQGGAVSARVRQQKELYGRSKTQIDLVRDLVRAAVATAWAQREAARRSIEAARTGVDAAGVALSGVQEEQLVGQRTTLDVLDAQRELLVTEETLVIAERDLYVANFALLSAVGRLTGEALGLPGVYDPSVHYEAVEGRWFGVTTPDGR